jgi:ATP-binding cassette subfamily B protein
MILLKQPLPKLNEINIEPLLFKNMITLNNVSFRHSEDLPYVLKNINLNFKKGSCTGFIGVTGSGKTTLLDIIMMLHKPSSGNLEVDSEIIDANNKRSWQANISHVPQSVYLSDSTIEENIAFGIESNLIDKDKVKKAAAQAEISDMIEKLDDGYLTMVGEGGLMLSGGQRQRIGIARALYKQSSVLIFDEATSALDSMTEKKIMNTISNLDKNLTIFIIAHRITTLKDCDQIIDLSNLGNAVVRKYNEIDH